MDCVGRADECLLTVQLTIINELHEAAIEQRKAAKISRETFQMVNALVEKLLAASVQLQSQRTERPALIGPSQAHASANQISTSQESTPTTSRVVQALFPTTMGAPHMPTPMRINGVRRSTFHSHYSYCQGVFSKHHVKLRFFFESFCPLWQNFRTISWVIRMTTRDLEIGVQAHEIKYDRIIS